MDKKYIVSGKIGILDADLMDNGTRHPNLALMKLAGYYNDLGCEVKLIYKDYNEIYQFDHVFISKVFDFTSLPDWVLKQGNVVIGGTGFFPDGGENLPEEIEHHKPHYDLYKEYVDEQLAEGRSRTVYADYLDYSIGFTTRGCFRKCSFCVNKKYDRTIKHSPVIEFLDETRPYIYLWDDNFLAYPEWREILLELSSSGKPFQFRQGIDLRLMTDEKAKVLNSVQYHGEFIFAFDHIDDSDLIIEKIQIWRRHSNKTSKFYVLCGYESQDEIDIANIFKRVAILMKYGSIPYLMRHDRYLQSKHKKLYIQLARWCNQPRFFKKMSFRQFCLANQFYKKDKSTDSAALSALKQFELQFPEIAKECFDLKYEELNAYSDQYGYGRKYSNKLLCKECINKGLRWTDLVNEKSKLLNLYFNREIDTECLHYKISDCIDEQFNILNNFIEILLSTSVSDLVNNVKFEPDSVAPIVCFRNMISYISAAIENLELLSSIGGLRSIICMVDRNLNENQLSKIENDLGKALCGLDLCKYRPNSGIRDIRLSTLGKYIIDYNVNTRKEIAARAFIRMPLLQSYFISRNKNNSTSGSLTITDLKAKELHEVKSILDFMKEYGEHNDRILR